MKYCCEEFQKAFEGYENEVNEWENGIIDEVKVNYGQEKWYEILNWEIDYCPFCGKKLK